MQEINSVIMGCGNCGSGGCGTSPAGCKNNGNCGTTGCNKLEVFDWLTGMERTASGESEFVEVRFKNTRKEYFKNTENLSLHVGEAVAVEATTGHDIGMVSLTGELVKFQMKKTGVSSKSRELKKIYRKAHEADLKLYREARDLEDETMVKTRKIVKETGLRMKISDVEYQGDKSRATFYYIAEERIDFRNLIKVLADTFKIRVDMRQIGARQEAGRVGGIGSCGRELCCSTWLTDFRSVSTSAARYQQLSINPMKLAGQCGKLKCCLNYELDSYLDAIRDFPDHRIKLKTKKGNAIHQKSDIFKGMMWYAYEDNFSEFIPVEIDRVKEVIALNQDGKTVDDLGKFKYEEVVFEKEVSFDNAMGQEDLTRFDQKKRNKNKKRRKPRPKGGSDKPQHAGDQRSGQQQPQEQKRNKKRRPPKKDQG
ncbi:MAG: regulatory iron-sulfur-containing complex subunit RicT [Salibacteraceae bacterium]